MQAVERVRITVQLRRLANSSMQESAASPFSAVPSQAQASVDRPSTGSTGKSLKKPGRASSSMSIESMRSVMSSLRSKHKPSAASSSDARNG